MAASEVASSELVLYYDDEWYPLYRNSSMSCADKVSNARKTVPVSDILAVMATQQFNGSWIIQVSDSSQAHIWFIVIANCQQAKVTGFSWSAELTQGQTGLYHQVSFDRQTLYFMYLFFGLVWLVGLALNVYSSVTLARRGAFHPIVRLFTTAIVIYELSLITQFIHHAVFAGNGIGLPPLEGFGIFCDMLSDVVFVLLLLLLAQGWAVSRQSIDHRLPMLVGAVVFVLLDIVLVLCMYYATDPASTAFVYLSVPGILALVVRVAVLAAFIALVVRSIIAESDPAKKRFFVMLGGIYSLYLVSLPLIALLSATLPAAYMYITTMWIYTLSKTISYGALLIMLLPKYAEHYFSISQPSLLSSTSSKPGGYSSL